MPDGKRSLTSTSAMSFSVYANELHHHSHHPKKKDLKSVCPNKGEGCELQQCFRNISTYDNHPGAGAVC